MYTNIPWNIHYSFNTLYIGIFTLHSANKVTTVHSSLYHLLLQTFHYALSLYKSKTLIIEWSEEYANKPIQLNIANIMFYNTIISPITDCMHKHCAQNTTSHY